ncbi:hypothetical protein [Shewanella baltica]|uniref:hypothetical protein n=1 Tax=Shewanella baltica TaxID=62322 RepID=UPI0024BAF884|nr:hypothetical protein [Shewanella baltica]
MSFIFPTDFGYHFEDDLKLYKKDILKALESKSSFQEATEHISPLISDSFIGKFWFTPRNEMIFILGFTSSGINNNIHRGSCSYWALVKIVKVKKTPSKSQKEQVFIKLLDELKSIIKEQNYSNELYSALHENVIKEIGWVEINDVLNNLEYNINNYIN